MNKATEELDYCPNSLARALSRKKKLHILAIYPLSFDHTFFSSLLEAIEEEGSDNGYHLLILSSA